jgi:hypothetical protein
MTTGAAPPTPDESSAVLREKIERYYRLMRRHDDAALRHALDDLIRLAQKKLDSLEGKS